MPMLEVAEKIEKALERHKLSVTRLQDELDSLIKIFSHMRECFENEMMDGLGYKKLALTDKQLKQGAGLSKMMTEMVNCKVRFDKAAKMMAESMTPEEERQAVMKYLQSLPYEERRSFVQRLREWMIAHHEAYVEQPPNVPAK